MLQDKVLLEFPTGEMTLSWDGQGRVVIKLVLELWSRKVGWIQTEGIRGYLGQEEQSGETQRQECTGHVQGAARNWLFLNICF